MKSWVRIVSDMALGGYQPYVAADDLPDPEWPDYSFQKLLKIGFDKLYIDTPDHPAIARLRGRL